MGASIEPSDFEEHSTMHDFGKISISSHMRGFRVDSEEVCCRSSAITSDSERISSRSSSITDVSIFDFLFVLGDPNNEITTST